MGRIRDFFGIDLPSPDVDPDTAPTFAIGPESIPAELFGLTSYSDPVPVSPRVSRTVALQCGAVSRAYDLVAGTIGTLPVQCVTPLGDPRPWPLFDQPERDVAPSITYTETIADMYLEDRAWWRVLETVGGWPSKVRRLDPSTVDVRRDQKVYVAPDGANQGAAWEWVPDAELIRFDSPTPGLLRTASRAIRTALNLQSQLENTATGIPPIDYFTPDPDADEFDADEVKQILKDWAAARKAGRTAFVPLSMKYNTAGWNPEQLQMDKLLDQAVVEIGRHAGIDPEDLGVSTTSRTYQNGQQRRADLIDFTVVKFMVALRGRLSMNDVCPRGYKADHDLTSIRGQAKHEAGPDSTTATPGIETPDASASVTPLRRAQ